MLGAASALLMTSAGHAADAVEAAPSGFNWSGFYVGLGGGFGAVGYNAGVGFGDLGGDGVFGELTAGYDRMLTDRLLLGGFIDTNLGNIGPELKGFFGPGTDAKITNKYGFDVGARLGYVLNASSLGYLLGGYTWQQVKGSGAAADGHESLDGYVLGLGMETAIADNWSIKTEYRYAHYSKDGVEPVTHTFHIAANYRFGAGGTGPAIASPVYDWSGFYVGASIGAGESVNDLSLGGVVDLNGLAGDGLFGEINAGYDHDFGNFVAGLMVDGNYSGVRANLGALGDDLKSDYGFDVLGRVGMKVNPSTLAYVLGGYSWGHFKAEDGGDTIKWSRSGYSVGGGLDTAVATNTTLGIEYRYTQFAGKDFDVVKIQPSSHTVRVGLKYKFN